MVVPRKMLGGKRQRCTHTLVSSDRLLMPRRDSAAAAKSRKGGRGGVEPEAATRGWLLGGADE